MNANMNLPITVEPTGTNSAHVMCRNYNAGGLKFLSIRVPIEWETPESKPQQIEKAKQQIQRTIERNIKEARENPR